MSPVFTEHGTADQRERTKSLWLRGHGVHSKARQKIMPALGGWGTRRGIHLDICLRTDTLLQTQLALGAIPAPRNFHPELDFPQGGRTGK